MRYKVTPARPDETLNDRRWIGTQRYTRPECEHKPRSNRTRLETKASTPNLTDGDSASWPSMTATMSSQAGRVADACALVRRSRASGPGGRVLLAESTSNARRSLAAPGSQSGRAAGRPSGRRTRRPDVTQRSAGRRVQG